MVYYGIVSVIGACRPGHTRALPGLFRIVRLLISRGPDAKTRRHQPWQKNVMDFRAGGAGMALAVPLFTLYANIN